MTKPEGNGLLFVHGHEKRGQVHLDVGCFVPFDSDEYRAWQAEGTIEERLEILGQLEGVYRESAIQRGKVARESGSSIMKDPEQRARIREGIARARREGKRLGRPPKYPPETARAIAEARARGASWSAIAHQYGLPRTSARQLCARAVPEHDGRSLRGGEREG